MKAEVTAGGHTDRHKNSLNLCFLRDKENSLRALMLKQANGDIYEGYEEHTMFRH
jgi:hypothetical protein